MLPLQLLFALLIYNTQLAVFSCRFLSYYQPSVAQLVEWGIVIP